jgi:hypothetical protein
VIRSTTLRTLPGRLVPLAIVSLALFARPAAAQTWNMAGQVGAGTGLEGGSPRDGGVSWHRARTRATVGLDMGVDEAAYAAFGVRAFVELEHSTTIGASLHYNFWLSPNFDIFGGFTGVIAPETMAGVEAGSTFVIPLGEKLGIFIEPSLAALPVGGDVPKGSVVVWALLSAGLRFNI